MLHAIVSGAVAGLVMAIGRDICTAFKSSHDKNEKPKPKPKRKEPRYKLYMFKEDYKEDDL